MPDYFAENLPPNEHPIDAVGAAEVDGMPPIEPTIPTIADLLPAVARRYVYALLPLMLLAVAVFDLPGALDKATLFVSAAGFGVAFSNVPKKVN